MNKLLLALACIMLASCSVNKLNPATTCTQYASCIAVATINCYSSGLPIYHAEGVRIRISTGGSFDIIEKDGSHKQVKADCLVAEKQQSE